MTVRYRCLTCLASGDGRACLAAGHHVQARDVAVPHGAHDARWHVPQVARRADGRWGVFCAACSHSHGDYVNPCHAFAQDDWPPTTLKEL